MNYDDREIKRGDYIILSLLGAVYVNFSHTHQAPITQGDDQVLDSSFEIVSTSHF